MKIKRGSTSVRRLIFIADSSSTTGAGLANLVYNTSSLVAYYFAGDLSNEVSITLATATLGTWTSGGFIAVDNTNMPGWYEIGIPNEALDGGNECAIQFRGAANMVPVNIYIELDTVDYQTDAMGALKPTVAGRTLDVTSTGEAGIDWANIGSPTTSVALSGTTISTSQAVGSVSGAVGSVTAGVTISGTTTTLDALQAALNLAHGSGSWATATGFSTLDAAGVRTAIGLASANLDTQLGDIPTVAEFEARSIVAANYATAANQTIIIDGIGYLLAQDTGAVSSPQTSTPAYSTSFNGSTYTVTHTGVTSTGVRGTAVRSKS